MMYNQPLRQHRVNRDSNLADHHMPLTRQGPQFIFPFINDEKAWQKHDVHFYERNLVRRGLDFTDTEDSKKDFLMRYALDVNCRNPIADMRKNPLPPIEELVEGAMFQLATGLKSGCETRKEVDRALRAADNKREWFPNVMGPFS